jgi:hypothetical protein
MFRIIRSKSDLHCIVLLGLCLLAGLLRVIPLMSHEPLIALANSYDEVRYTACFDLYPYRPDVVDPTSNSPEAPIAHYAFAANPSPMCYWSTELVSQGAVVMLYKAQHWLTGATRFSVRWIGALKFAALLLMWTAFSLAFLRRGESRLMLANGLLLPLVFADPANTVYLNTFYAEWTALLALYATLGLILLHDNRVLSRRVFCLIALAGCALALSKIQHLLLPLACAVVVLLLDRMRGWRWSARGSALLLGAVLGLAVQAVQLQRDSPAIAAISHYNRADVTFTGLLPHARDPAATARNLGIAPDCLQYIGKSAWQIGVWPDSECPQLANVTRARELATLLREPDLFVRMMWHGVSSLDPWLAPGLGLVEGGDLTPLPDEFFTLSRVFSAHPAWRVPPLLAPLLICIGLLWRAQWRIAPRLFTFSALASVVMLTTLTITLLGDGLADTPKQGHFIPNMALAWWLCVVVPTLGLLRRPMRDTRLPVATPSLASHLTSHAR